MCKGISSVVRLPEGQDWYHCPSEVLNNGIRVGDVHDSGEIVKNVAKRSLGWIFGHSDRTAERGVGGGEVEGKDSQVQCGLNC